MTSLPLSLLLLAASQVATPTAPDSAFTRTEPARLELQVGRASLVNGGASSELRRGVVRQVAGQAHLELYGSTRVHLSFGARASLDLFGPCTLEWGECTRAGASALDLEIRFHQLGEVELEVRRGVHQIELPGDWRLLVGAGAMQFQGRLDGPTEVNLHAGPETAIHWHGDRGRPRPPLWARAGTPCLLSEPPPSRPDLTRAAPAWEFVSWPWRRATEDQRQRREREAMNQRLLASDRIGPWPPPWVEPSALASLGVLPGVDEIEIVKLGPEPSAPREPDLAYLKPGRNPPLERADYQDHHWRGVRWEDLRWAGPVIAQRVSGLVVSELGRGRIKLALTSAADTGVWIFAPEEDLRMEPGAVVLFSAEGRLEGRFGRYHPETVIEGRPTRTPPPLPGDLRAATPEPPQ